MSLRTYGQHSPIVPLISYVPGSKFSHRPGDWVKHFDYGGVGIIVAMSDSQLTVLWSQEPRSVNDFPHIQGQQFMEMSYVFAPYVPLQVSKTILETH